MTNKQQKNIRAFACRQCAQSKPPHTFRDDRGASYCLWPPYVIGRPLYFCPVVSIFMVALWNRADHYIFMLWFVLLPLLSSFFSSPNLSRRRLFYYSYAASLLLSLLVKECNNRSTFGKVGGTGTIVCTAYRHFCICSR